MGLRQFFGLEEVKKVNVDKIFANIIGQDDAKAVLTMAIQSVKPVHILLKGPYGIGKTELMLDVANHIGRKNTHFGIGSRISKAGLTDLFIKNPNLDYLFIDELETMKKADQAVLLSVMQHGIVSETLYKKTKGREAKVNVRVIATTNDTRNVLRALQTRFGICEMGAYTQEEFTRVAVELCKSEDVTPSIAANIARLVYHNFYEPTPRDPVRIARLSKGDEDKIIQLIRIMGKKRGGGEQ
jgi:holliday junction DNA helicase RuvB